SLGLTVLHADERVTPEGREPIRWRLLTNCPVDDLAAAIERLDWYALHFKIETFHKPASPAGASTRPRRRPIPWRCSGPCGRRREDRRIGVMGRWARGRRAARGPRRRPRSSHRGGTSIAPSAPPPRRRTRRSRSPSPRRDGRGIPRGTARRTRGPAR